MTENTHVLQKFTHAFHVFSELYDSIGEACAGVRYDKENILLISDVFETQVCLNLDVERFIHMSEEDSFGLLDPMHTSHAASAWYIAR